MKRHNPPSLLDSGGSKTGMRRQKAGNRPLKCPQKTLPRSKFAATGKAAVQKAIAKPVLESDFSVCIISAEAARPLLNETQRPYLRAGSLVFSLQSGGAAQNIAAFGFCIVHNKGEQKTGHNAAAVLSETASPETANYEPHERPAAKPVPVLRFMAENIVKSHQDKNFLEIALFHIADKRKTPRAKTLLLRAVADYCRKKQIDYIFGQFSFEGKYPAAYAREFSYLYHHYRVKKGFAPAGDSTKSVSMDIMPAEAVPPDKTRRFLPPLLRYCLRLGAKAGDRVTIDKSYDKGTGAMNVFLLMPLNLPEKTANITAAGTAPDL